LHAGAAPGGPEVEHDDLLPLVAEAEPPAIERLQLEVGSRLAHQFGFDSRHAASFCVSLGKLGLDGRLQLPPLIGTRLRLLLDGPANNESVDIAQHHSTPAENIARAF